MEYNRVIPRDFFNESKLLKCMGHLALKIHDSDELPCEMEIMESGEPFIIKLSLSGSLYIQNYPVIIKGRRFIFMTTYNSKSPYPFYCDHDDCEIPVFDDNGNFEQEFIDFCKSL